MKTLDVHSLKKYKAGQKFHTFKSELFTASPEERGKLWNG